MKAGASPLVANLLSHSGLLKILGANGTEDYLYLVAVQDVIDQYEFSAMDHMSLEVCISGDENPNKCLL